MIPPTIPPVLSNETSAGEWWDSNSKPGLLLLPVPLSLELGPVRSQKIVVPGPDDIQEKKRVREDGTEEM